MKDSYLCKKYHFPLSLPETLALPKARTFAQTPVAQSHQHFDSKFNIVSSNEKKTKEQPFITQIDEGEFSPINSASTRRIEPNFDCLRPQTHQNSTPNVFFHHRMASQTLEAKSESASARANGYEVGFGAFLKHTLQQALGSEKYSP